WRSSRTRTLAASATVALIAVVAVALVRNRPGGFDAEQLRRVVGQSGEHLRQIVGVLGWLDAAVPWLGVFLFWAALGGLGLVAMMFAPRVAAIGLGAIALAVGLAWMMELGQAWSYGNYWQGRYTLPFAIGWGLVFASGWRSRTDPISERRMAWAIGAMAWAVWNFGFVAAQQRWAVGKDGSYLPWEWNTWGSPVNPMLLCVIHAVLSAWFVRLAIGASTQPEPASR
ncbi:MAG TPA: hypothetical protein PKV27_04440, partial [Ilumatobacteraceae bacterium]|nr:hypothetical protein [Ilumatobacteraceae bacterium]